MIQSDFEETWANDRNDISVMRIDDRFVSFQSIKIGDV